MLADLNPGGIPVAVYDIELIVVHDPDAKHKQAVHWGWMAMAASQITPCEDAA